MSRFVFAVVLLGSNAATVLAASVGTNVGSGCVTNYDSTQNYFPFAYNSSEPFALPVSQTIVNTALDFSVQYQKSYKLVRSNVSNVEFLLYQVSSFYTFQLSIRSTITCHTYFRPVKVGLTAGTPAFCFSDIPCPCSECTEVSQWCPFNFYVCPVIALLFRPMPAAVTMLTI